MRNLSGAIIGVNEKRFNIEDLIKQGFEIVDSKPKKPLPLNYIDIQIATSTNRPDGYGQSAQYLMGRLREEGITYIKKNKNQQVGLCYYTPLYLKGLYTKYKILYTMFESTSIPENWVKPLQEADLVLVPSKFCQKAFLTKGIKTKVVPLGYDDEKYKLIERKRRGNEPFTFLHYNAFNIRKGFDLVFKAFTEEFKDEENVKLILKTINPKTPFPILKSEYQNIEVIKGEYNTKQMNDLLERCDVFVFPSRGEGFGLTPLETLATGMTAIIPNGSGMSEYFDERYFIEAKIKGEVQSVYHNYNLNEVGNMIEVDIEDLKKKMRWAYKNRDKVKEMGVKGSKWVEKYNSEQWAKKLSKVIKDFNSKIDK